MFQDVNNVFNDLRFAKTEAFICNSPDNGFVCVIGGVYPCGPEDGNV